VSANQTTPESRRKLFVRMAKPLPYKVLIVDGDMESRKIVLSVLQELNVETVEIAIDGRKARDAIYESYDAARPFDIVFLAWNLPEIAGIDILKDSRMHSEFADTAFIMLTADNSRSEDFDAAKSGAAPYIVEPAFRETITKKFLQAVEWKKRRSESQRAAPPSRRVGSRERGSWRPSRR
jgi:DNA-binding response OmpR family regulator